MNFSTNNIALLIVLFLAACSGNTAEKKETSPPPTKIVQETPVPNQEIVNEAFQGIIDAEKVTGSILIFDSNNETFHSNDFERSKKGFIPASTFKIPNSLIALETGIIANDSTVIKWDGTPRRLNAWNKDLTFREAFHASCVPCYQDIARKVGTDRMNDYISKFEYGELDINSTTIDNFWLTGKSKISQQQQIEFLRKFYFSKLPIKKETEVIAKRMMLMEDKAGQKLTGKTGWSGGAVSWFVGFLETSDNIYFFATNISHTGEFNPATRQQVTMKALEAILST